MVPPHLKHYPASRARREWGCDCWECLPSGRARPGRPPGQEAALTQRERNLKLRRAKRGKPVPPGTKHGIYAYRVYGCLCEICRAARSRQAHREKNPWMYRPTHGRWSVQGPRTVLCWPPAGAPEDWVCPTCERGPT